MNQYFFALLSTIWALVATVIGLLLYRSSSALFEMERRTERVTQRIRAVGSIVIAGAAFFAMQRTVPPWVLSSDPPARRTAAVDLADEIHKLDRAILELKGCQSLGSGYAMCQEKMDDLTRSAAAVSQISAQLVAPR